MSSFDPGRLFDDSLAELNRRAIGAIAPSFFKGLSTLSEPFFRKNLGERYFDSTSINAGFGIWLLATALCIFGISVIGPFSIVIGLMVTGCFAFLASENRKAALRRHYEGTPRHSMSRGEPRFRTPVIDKSVRILLSLALVFLATPIGVLLIISQFISAMLAAKQQEALMARYYDAMDSKIEAEELESALLGQSPPENTFLYKALPETMPEDFRKNIAAANRVRPATQQLKRAAIRLAPDPSPATEERPPEPPSYTPPTASPSTVAEKVSADLRQEIPSPIVQHRSQDQPTLTSTRKSRLMPTPRPYETIVPESNSGKPMSTQSPVAQELGSPALNQAPSPTAGNSSPPIPEPIKPKELRTLRGGGLEQTIEIIVDGVEKTVTLQEVLIEYLHRPFVFKSPGERVLLQADQGRWLLIAVSELSKAFPSPSGKGFCILLEK